MDSGRDQSSFDDKRERTREDRFGRSASKDSKEDSKSGSDPDVDHNAIWRRRRKLRGGEAVLDTMTRGSIQDVDCTFTEPVDTPGNGDNANNLSDADRPFPFTNAQYIAQTDILEDGLPPVPRAIAAQRHLEVMILVKEVTHLAFRLLLCSSVF